MSKRFNFAGVHEILEKQYDCYELEQPLRLKGMRWQTPSKVVKKGDVRRVTTNKAMQKRFNFETVGISFRDNS